MKICGIICEYDPFHNGHAYLLAEAKKTSDAVVAVMSGAFTERGGAAIADPLSRAEMAVRGGADLVLEMPFPFSAAPAPYFARAGVEILAAVGAEKIMFGSESGDAGKLKTLATVALSDTFSAELTRVRESDRELGTAAAYFRVLSEFSGGEMPGPNDILGIEYIKAILAGGYDITPTAVRRLGDGYRAGEPGDSPYASATAVRAAICAGQPIDRYVPPFTVEILAREIAEGKAPARLENAERAVLSFFRLADPETLGKIAGLGNGLGNRLCECAARAGSLPEFFALAATKKYTDAAIRRAVLYAMTGTTDERLDAGVSETRVLGASAKGRGILAGLRREDLPFRLCVKPSGITDPTALRAEALYALTLPQIADAGEWKRRSPFLIS